MRSFRIRVAVAILAICVASCSNVYGLKPLVKHDPGMREMVQSSDLVAVGSILSVEPARGVGTTSEGGAKLKLMVAQLRIDTVIKGIPNSTRSPAKFYFFASASPIFIGERRVPIPAVKESKAVFFLRLDGGTWRSTFDDCACMIEVPENAVILQTSAGDRPELVLGALLLSDIGSWLKGNEWLYQAQAARELVGREEVIRKLNSALRTDERQAAAACRALTLLFELFGCVDMVTSGSDEDARAALGEARSRREMLLIKRTGH